MNRSTGVFLLGFILIFFLFICEESVRLRYDNKAVPLIAFDKTKYCVTCLEKDETATVEYYSLFFKTDVEYVGLGYGEYKVTRKEFYLLYRILTWAWVE